MHNAHLGQYRQVVRSQRRVVRFGFLLWGPMLVLLAVAMLRGWPWALHALFAFALLGGVVQHFNEFMRLRDYKARCRAAEAQSQPPPEP